MFALRWSREDCEREIFPVWVFAYSFISLVTLRPAFRSPHASSTIIRPTRLGDGQPSQSQEVPSLVEQKNRIELQPVSQRRRAPLRGT